MSVFRLFSFGNNRISSCRNLLCSREIFKNCKEQRVLISNAQLEELGIPLKPKRPCTPYIKFGQNIRPKILENNPNLKAPEVFKLIAQEWSKCDPEEKKSLQKEFMSDLEIYLKEIEVYNKSITPEQQNIIKSIKEKKKQAKEQARINEKKESLGKPKRPLTGFLKFLQDCRPQKEDNIKYSEWIRRMSREWEAMSEEKKDKYKTEAQSALDKYKSDLIAWEENMIRQGHIDVVRNKELLESTETKKRLKKINQ